jgi:hypothetical protein
MVYDSDFALQVSSIIYLDSPAGYIVGNGVTDEQIDGNALVPFVHGMGLISDELFEVKIYPFKSKFGTISIVLNLAIYCLVSMFL